MQAARWTLDAYHRQTAGIAVTEFGCSGPPPGQGDPVATGEQQAAPLTQTVSALDAESRRLGVRAIDWFAYRDGRGPAAEDRLGLLAVDASPKPAWHALRELAR